MKKNIVMLGVSLLSLLYADCQRPAEWTQQKKTQKKYLLQQIAALQDYLGYAKEGYEIAGKGIRTIHNIREGDFNLHEGFFSSLKNVNPVIRRYAKVAEIAAFQVRILRRAQQTMHDVRDAKRFTTAETEYCKGVFYNLLKECIKAIDELFMVITLDQLELKDDERIKRVDKIYLDMQDKYSFCSSFSEEMLLLSVQRSGDHAEIKRSKRINALK